MDDVKYYDISISFHFPRKVYQGETLDDAVEMAISDLYHRTDAVYKIQRDFYIEDEYLDSRASKVAHIDETIDYQIYLEDKDDQSY